MSDWEASEDQAPSKAKPPTAAPHAPPKKKWADEDEEESDEVASDWEESEEEEVKKPAPKSQVPVPAKKPTLQQRIESKAAAKANGAESDTEDDMIDPLLKKRLEREREVEADMKNASDLLGATSIGSSSKDLSDILKANPKTKEDFIHLSNRIIEVVVKRLQNRPLYAQFLEHHIRELATPLKDVDVRKCASTLTTLANEKQKEQRDPKKKKGAKTALLTKKAGKVADTSIYNEALDDFGDGPDDFM